LFQCLPEGNGKKPHGTKVRRNQMADEAVWAFEKVAFSGYPFHMPLTFVD
jgi:hypothetical protein